MAQTRIVNVHKQLLAAVYEEPNQKTFKSEVTGVCTIFLFRFQDYLYIMHARPQQVRRQLAGQPIRSLHCCYVYSSSGQADSVCYCCSRIPVLLKFRSVCLTRIKSIYRVHTGTQETPRSARNKRRFFNVEQVRIFITLNSIEWDTALDRSVQTHVQCRPLMNI